MGTSAPVDSEEEDQISRDYARALEDDAQSRVVAQVGHDEHARIEVLSNLRQEPFEIGKEGWVVERPDRGVLQIPL